MYRIQKLNKICPKIFKEISNIKNFNLKYTPSIKIEEYTKENIKEILEDKFKTGLEKEIMAKTTLYGPHRDDFEFNVEEDNLNRSKVYKMSL